MADSVNLDIQGPDWPLGVIVVTTPGTPVSFMSLVDPTNSNAPQTAVSSTNKKQYTARCNQIIISGYKKGVTHGLVPNVGMIYVVREGAGGLGNRDDYGAMVVPIAPGQTFVLEAPATQGDVFSPYRYFLDADNASDAAVITLVIG